MYNKIILAGNLTRDIEIKYTQSGAAIGNTAIATTRKFKSQTGEQKEEVLFIDITFFGRTAEVANQYLKKGSKVLVDGRLKLDQWTAQDGSKRSKHSVIVESLQMLGDKNESQSTTQSSTEYDSNHVTQNHKEGETVKVDYLGEVAEVNREVLEKMYIGNLIDITFPSYALQFVKRDNKKFEVTTEGLTMDGNHIVPEKTIFSI